MPQYITIPIQARGFDKKGVRSSNTYVHACEREIKKFNNPKTHDTYVRLHLKMCEKCRESYKDFRS